MDVFIVKCLREERGNNVKSNKVSTGKPYVMSASLHEPASVLLLQMCSNIIKNKNGILLLLMIIIKIWPLILDAYLEFSRVLWKVFVSHVGRMLVTPLDQRGEPGLVL